MKRICCVFVWLSGLFLVSWAQTEDFVNSVGMEFVGIPAGSFYMGNPVFPARTKAPSGASDEAPWHKVEIKKSFQLGKYEITVGQFRQFPVAEKRDDLLTDEFVKCNSHGDNAAVCWVSWNDTQDFIDWLNAKEGGKRYRLPTEAQWEYATCAGSSTPYFWGYDPEKAVCYAWYKKNADEAGEKYPHVVGQKSPTHGACMIRREMSGNGVRTSTARSIIV